MEKNPIPFIGVGYGNDIIHSHDDSYHTDSSQISPIIVFLLI